MAEGSVLKDVFSKLDWAERRHVLMQESFKKFARPGGGDERPIGIEFDPQSRRRPVGWVVARFIVEESVPKEVSLLAADLVHNTRTALDHVVARLKDRFGGAPGQGGFPICQLQENWDNRVVSPIRGKGPLDGLDQVAVDLIYDEQPLHRDAPKADPLIVLNRLDNDDKHQMMYPSYVYTGVEKGVDMIELLDSRKVMHKRNGWEAGQPLDDGTEIARFLVLGEPQDVLQARRDAPIGFATGGVGEARTSYTAMIERVRDIAAKAVALIDAS